MNGLLFLLTTSSYVARVVSTGSARDKYVSEQPVNCGSPSLFPPFLSSFPCLSIPLYQPCASSNYMYIVIDFLLNNFPFVRAYTGYL